MGQHKLQNRTPMPTRWILCTKWFNEYKDKDGKDQVKAFWTPIGTRSKIPVSYTTEREAIASLKELVNQDKDLANQRLLFVTCEVKYVPPKVKLYNESWFKKYVIKEDVLKIHDKNKGKDTFNG